MSEANDFLELNGKSFLVLGVANKKSVAYHVAQQLESLGAHVIYSVRSEQRRAQMEKLLPEREVHICDVGARGSDSRAT